LKLALFLGYRFISLEPTRNRESPVEDGVKPFLVPQICLLLTFATLHPDFAATLIIYITCFAHPVVASAFVISHSGV